MFIPHPVMLGDVTSTLDIESKMDVLLLAQKRIMLGSRLAVTELDGMLSKMRNLLFIGL